MADDEHNPYAAPAPVAFREPSRAVDHDGPNAYEAERRPVLLVVILSCATLGLYPAIWLIRRQPFLDRRGVDKTLGGALPIFVLVTNVLGFFLAMMGHEAATVRPLFSLVGTVAAIVANFRVLGILRSDSARTGRFLEFSTIGTFFLGCYYLQYKMNQMADTPARVGGPRRKKRKKPPVEGAEDATTSAADTETEPETTTEKAG